MINNNKKFTFANAFNVIDTHDRGYVTYKKFKKFFEES
jgi:hypothetical protein